MINSNDHDRPIPTQQRSAQQRGDDIERQVRAKFSDYLQTPLVKARVEIEPIGDKSDFEVDFIDSAQHIVGEVKAHTWRRGRLFPNGKFEGLERSLLAVHRLKAPVRRRILVLADDLNSESGESLISRYLTNLQGNPLITGVEIWRYDEDRGIAVQIVGKARGLIIGRTAPPPPGGTT